jgi:phosphoribosylcarboxyaminoimidazole (NCAIR) mutase
MDKEETKYDVSIWTFMPLKAYESPAEPVPEITDWKPGAQAFNDQSRRLGEKAPLAAFPQAVVGLFGTAGHLLHAWAEMRGAQVLEPPVISSLLDGTAALWSELRHPGETLFVIPDLERCFLRHYRGIRLARQLVETVWAQPCRLVIGCDAWAWKYLCTSVQIDALFLDALTAAPLMAPPVPSDTAPDLASHVKNLSVHAYVLHTLLVHDGVNASVLPQLLPFRATEVLKTLADLRKQKLAFEEDGTWRVALEHYAGIRRHLAKMDFWISDA